MNHNNIAPQTQSEIDIPPTSTISSKKMDKKSVDNLEKMNEMARKNYMTKNGLRLLISIICAMLFLAIIDTVLTNFGLACSEFVTTVMDFGKYIATTLLGFLFANKTTE